MSSQQTEGCSFAGDGFSRSRFEPIRCHCDAALKIVFYKGLKHNDLEFAGIVIRRAFTLAKVKVEIKIEIVLEVSLVFHFLPSFGHALLHSFLRLTDSFLGSRLRFSDSRLDFLGTHLNFDRFLHGGGYGRGNHWIDVDSYWIELDGYRARKLRQQQLSVFFPSCVFVGL